MSDPTIPAGMKAHDGAGRPDDWNGAEVMLRCGRRIYMMPADDLRWAHTGGPEHRAEDIIAYTPALSTPTTPDEGEAESRSYTTDGVKGGGADRVTQAGEEAKARAVEKAYDDTRPIGSDFWHERTENDRERLTAFALAFRASEGEALREALEPFARLADDFDAAALDYLGVGIDGLLPDRALPVGGEAVRDKCTVTIGALIAARAALKGER